MTISCRQICRAHGRLPEWSRRRENRAPAEITWKMFPTRLRANGYWHLLSARWCGVIRFVRWADGGVTAKTMWKDEENDRKLWWRRGGGKMGSISSAWLSASKRSRVSDCSKWQIKGPFMLLHKCSLRTGCETERRVCAVVQLSRS